MASLIFISLILAIMFICLTVYALSKKDNKNIKKYAILALISFVVFFVGLKVVDTVKYEIIGAHTFTEIDDVFVVEVKTTEMDKEKIAYIAKKVTDKYRDDKYRLIRVFYYLPGQEPQKGKPEHRITWSSSDNKYKLDY